jgi:hypothetical protein
MKIENHGFKDLLFLRTSKNIYRLKSIISNALIDSGCDSEIAKRLSLKWTKPFLPDEETAEIFSYIHNADYSELLDLVQNRPPLVFKIDEHGCTLLHYAVKGGRIDLVMCLIELGANINHQSYTGMTPLHMAIGSGKHTYVNYLLEKGAIINLPNDKGLTPLGQAILSRKYLCIKILVDSGSGLEVKIGENGKNVVIPESVYLSFRDSIKEMDKIVW